MYAGRIVEVGPATEIFARPLHPYSAGLLASIPRLEGTGAPIEPIPGQPPDLAALGEGCAFAPRCRHASPECRAREPTLREIAPGRMSACLFPERLGGGR
jgi:oligopeptide/dipeptide ABC transporter ATP-binding protein